MTQNPNLAALSAAGVSVWLDDLSRDLLDTGRLADLVQHWAVTGATSNPTILAVSQAQPNQAKGPTSQPQLMKKPCEKIRPSSSESSATATSCTTATRQKTSNLTAGILPFHGPRHLLLPCVP